MVEEHLNYFRNDYSHYWIKQVRIYGEDSYTKSIIKILINHKPKTVFEFAIGTGWPIAFNLYKRGIHVDGCDISPYLVRNVKKNYPKMNVYICNGLSFEISSKYDLVYCIRASWYIDNFINELNKMINMTKSGGNVVFDIMNKHSLYFIKEHFFYYPIYVIKCIFKGEKVKRPGLVFYNCQEIENFLKNKNIKFKVYSENQLIGRRRGGGKKKFNSKSNKILYVCEII